MARRGVTMAMALLMLFVMSPVAQAATWQSTATSTNMLLRSVDFQDADTGLAVGAAYMVLRTDDGGATWRQTEGGMFGSGWYDVAWASPTTVYAVGANAIFQPMAGVSHDGGESWVGQSFYIDNNEGTLRGVAVSATHVLVAATLWNGEGVILQKPLADAPLVGWTPVLRVGHPLVGIDADGPFAVAVGAEGSVYTSLTGGLTWAPVLTPTDAFLFDVAVSLPSAVAVGADGTAIRTTDLGLSWQATDTGSDATLRGVALTGGGAAAAVGDGGVVRMSGDGGATWGPEASGTTESLWGVGMHEGPDGFATAAVGARGTAIVRAG